MKYFELKEFYLVIMVASICTLILLFAPESIHLLRYQSLEVSNGEWWRLITANFTHSGWNHWLLNLSGLVLIDYLYQPTIKQINRTSLLVFCIFLNVIFLHIFMSLEWYVGLSGALHGYLIGGALLSFKQTKIYSCIIILVVSIKLVSELTWEINQFTADMIAANVVEESHFFGAISAVIYVVLVSIFRILVKDKSAE